MFCETIAGGCRGQKKWHQEAHLMPLKCSNACSEFSAVPCFLKANSAIISASLPMKGCRFSGLLQKANQHRRASLSWRYFFGLVDSCVVHSLTGAPRGKPSGLMLPFGHSANPRGVAHPFSGGVNGFKNRTKGKCTMSATQSQGGNPSESLTPEVVQAFLSHNLPSDLSDNMVDRLKAASDTAFGILYHVTEGAYHARQWAPTLSESQRQDLEAFMRGVVRVVSSETIARDWNKANVAQNGEGGEDD